MRQFVSGEVERGIHARFADLEARRRFDPADLAAGRAYVASYVSFVHYAEGIHDAARNAAVGHYPDDAAASPGEMPPHRH